MTAGSTTAADAADPGLQAERTVLAWRRTAVAAMANALLLLHTALDSGWRPATLVPLAAVLALLVAAAVCVWRGRMLSLYRDGGPPDVRATVALTAAVAVAAVGAVSAALVLYSWAE
ncbi:DUF202 domain-containing protein [Nocardia sp. alder85J]|uniref:DUF202 domain-containing protein n=1 Tax=Nocardia sp. alder85J TaxID=2862949 RepID=UPI001CD607FB|nr:DUF202 domain-containing protein [Nocardia sp. alder85J]MCX4094115.1 DUF202 domain-containing protein [Nocardia sp. alder85J]